MRSIFLILILCSISYCSCFTPIVDDKTSSLNYRRNRPRTITQRVSTNRSSLEKCGRRQIEQQRLILSGSPTEPGDWPWHAAVYNLTGPDQTLKCGGTLITKYKVITAATCVSENNIALNTTELTVYFGKHDIYKYDGIQQKNILNIILHEGYQSNNSNNDLAILILEAEVLFSNRVQPICLWKDTFGKSDNETGIVVGWDKPKSKELKKALLTMTDYWDCFVNPNDNKIMDAKKFCAVSSNVAEGGTPCFGDKGSGFYVTKEVNGIKHWFLRGVVLVSSNIKNGSCDTTGYTIFLDLAYYVKFVDENKEKN